MTTRDHAEPDTIAWVDLPSPDPEKTRAFYAALLGWSFAEDDPNASFYSMARIGGRTVAGIGKLPPGAPFQPTWTVYFATDDADALARKVADAGGKVVLPPMDVMDQGRMAYFADPTGAHFGAWQARKRHGAQLVDDDGALAWAEVYTRDVEKAGAFYARVFHLEAKPIDAPGIEYFTLRNGARTVCGLMQMGPQFPEHVPSHWNTYFAVADADAAAERVVALGGAIVAPPFDTPFGRMFVAKDPLGAHVCLIRTIGPSSGW